MQELGMEDPGMEGVERWNLALSAGAAAAGYALVSPLFAASLLAGAALEAVNFRHLLRSGKQLFAGRSHSWTAGYALRFAILALGIGVAIYAGAHPVGFVVGLSLILPAVVVEAWRNRPPISTDAPALDPDDPSWDRWDPWLARERQDDPEDAW
jgi:hypothetical protein